MATSGMKCRMMHNIKLICLVHHPEKAEQYIEHANNDIERIIEAQEEVIEVANRIVGDYNLFIKTVKVERM